MAEPSTRDDAKPAAPSGRPQLKVWAARVRASSDAPANMRRVILEIPGAEQFSYEPGQAMVVMVPLADGTVGRRDYTIRALDRAAGTIAIDILKHGETPGPAWAIAAKPGDTIEIKGPRGKTVFSPRADWHLLTGDETCIPAIAHILETMPAGTKAHVFIEVDTPADEIKLETRAELSLVWLHRNGAPAGPGNLMSDAVAEFELPAGRGQAYIIGETSNVRRQRQDLVARGLSREQILSEGYWRPGRIGGHDHVDD
ncbi:siderophore-interacting protein [Aquamicrobium sp. LC103]|uniref:siderophore-interacting protein n=1 Tax=Aquamicrobium sp. LC103 TaxID=1120658 RepID=UPI00063E9553|nr:siderophore-interacting protein [Aquamicrobium sp. LC103]TKT69698.1 siderophore-interacting protein [Aquamicrobium sp. LC103]